MKTFLTSLLFITMLESYSQTIENFSIDSGGDITSNGGINLIYTIGEITINDPAAGNVYLSSGFINGSFNATITAIEESPISDSRILIHPNPSSGCVNIKTALFIDYLELYDARGKRVIHQKNYASCLDVSTLKPGLYILRIISGDIELSESIMINN